MMWTLQVLDVLVGDYFDLFLAILWIGLQLLLVFWPFLLIWYPANKLGELMDSSSSAVRGVSIGLVVLALPFAWGTWRYYTTLPYGYAMSLGWREPIVKEVVDELSQKGYGPAALFVDKLSIRGSSASYPSESLSAFYHHNIVGTAGLDSWLIRHRVNPWATYKGRLDDDPIYGWAYIIGIFGGFPAVLARAMAWPFWSLVLMVYPLVSPFLVGVLACLLGAVCVRDPVL